MTPIAGLLCIAVGWDHLPRGRGRFEMVGIQVGQWAAVLVAMYLIHVSNVDGLVTHDALGSILLTLLALGVFISGLDLRTWKLCVAGAFLALAVPFVAWFEDAGVVHVSHRRPADRARIAHVVGRPSVAPARLSQSLSARTLVGQPGESATRVRERSRAGACAAATGWRLKSDGEVGRGKPAGRGSFAIALRVHDVARVTGGRIGTGEAREQAVSSRASRRQARGRLGLRRTFWPPRAQRRFSPRFRCPDARRSVLTLNAPRRSCRRSSRRSRAGRSPRRAQTSRRASGGPFFMIRSLTSSCGSSWCPTRRSRRTRPIIARRWR